MRDKGTGSGIELNAGQNYGEFLGGIGDLLEAARRTASRSVNALMTATYWEMGRRIVQFDQGGRARAGYGKKLLEQLSLDLTRLYGRGFSRHNLARFRDLYLSFPLEKIRATVSLESNTPSLLELAEAFPLPWSHYVTIMSRSRSPQAAEFYLAEAIRGGWTVRQLKRQMDSQFYERIALSRNKVKAMKEGRKVKQDDSITPEEGIRDPLVLEFLGLKDNYSENDLEEALIHNLETFLLELGDDFAFIGRQRRLRIDDEWFRVDLVFYHRHLRCLVIIDLKLGRFTHADAGQMHLYLNYARENWTHEGENPPVGIILCATKGESLVRYATEGLPSKTLVREYLMALPEEEMLAAQIRRISRDLAKGGN